MIKILKNIGLIIFLVGVVFFIGSFFLAHYKLNPETIKIHIEDAEKLHLMESAGLKNIYNKKYTSNFRFVSDLNKTFQNFNDQVIEIYSINDNELDAITNAIVQNSYIFKPDLLNKAFTGDHKEFKIRKIKDYSGHLEGKSFNDESSIKKEFQSIAEKIRKYGILSEKGFDKYRIGDLRYALAKASTKGPVKEHPLFFLFLTFGLSTLGAIIFFLPKIKEGPPGIKNNNNFYHPMKNLGWIGIVAGILLLAYYIILYFYPEYMTNWIVMVDPVSYWIKGSDAGRFFLYGFMYTLSILVMGVRMFIHYRHSKYHIVRTISVMFFQLAFAFLIPEILVGLNKPYFDFKNIWPLNYDFFFDYRLNNFISSGTLGVFMLVWGIILIVIGVPVITYFLGKRWYCSWVCGCGGLAETLGDPFRHLSDKSLKAWRIERWMVHGVLVFAVLMTIGVLYTYFTGSSNILGINTYTLREIYGVWIGAGFAGVIGVGFYPFMGNRVWCRFGCPLAAYLGIIQRFKSRFRITTNGGQCISCGNCSTYCEMGIDVRWYAQRGQNIVRSSCVGCGICASVCPRGVLKLENKEEKGRFGKPILIGNDSYKVEN